jgi:hypothetical protein
MELIKDQHKSPALLRYADRITENRFDSNGGFNLAGGIADARWVFLPFFLPFFLPSFLSFYSHLPPPLKGILPSDHVYTLWSHCLSTLQPGCIRLVVRDVYPTLDITINTSLGGIHRPIHRLHTHP